MSIETKILFENAGGFSSNTKVAFDGTNMTVAGTAQDLAQLSTTTISATSEIGTNLAVNVNDGNATTFWLSGTLFGNERLTLDLKKNYVVSSMVITTNSTDKIVDYEILGSNDNISYTSIFSENGNTDEVITVALSTPYRFYRLQVTAVTNTQVKVFSIAVNGTIYHTDNDAFVYPQYIKADSITELKEESIRDNVPATLSGGTGPYRITADSDQMVLRIKDVDATFSLTQSVKVADVTGTVQDGSFPTLTAANNAYDITIDGIQYASALTGDYSITPPTLTQLITELNTFANTVQTGLTIPTFDIAFDNGGYLEFRGRELVDISSSTPSEINITAVANDFYTELGFTVADTSGTDVAIATVITDINNAVQAQIEIGKVVADNNAGNLRLRDTDNDGYIALIDVVDDAYTALAIAVSSPDTNNEVANASTEFDISRMDIRYFVKLHQDKSYFYSTITSTWVEVTAEGYQQASTLADINENWGDLTFYENTKVQIIPVLKSVTGVATPELYSITIVYSDNQSVLIPPNSVEVNLYVLNPTTSQPAEGVTVRVSLVRPNVTNNGYLLLNTFKESVTNADGLAQFFLTTTDGASIVDPKGLYLAVVPANGTRQKFNVPNGPPIRLFV